MTTSPTAADIITQLSRYQDGKPFPAEAVRAAVTLREEITPLLLSALESAASNVPGIKGDDILHIYSMYLLAQFGETRLYPVLLKFFSWPEEAVEDAVGDLIDEDLAQLLVSVYDGDSSSLKTLVENEDASEYVRSAGLEAFAGLAATGKLPREEVVEYFRGLFNGNLKPADSFVWTGLILACLDLHPGALMKEIRKAYELALVDDELISLEEVESAAKEDLEKVLAQTREHSKPVEDTEESMAWWACFQPLPAAPRQEAQPEKRAAAEPVEAGAKVGRNDPCPCGSQKKFKKCCGKAE
ncbi:MAG: hypothetical protein JWL90_2707 [Chthoniobacteraceae bacterium]|nr:hypothetical protein [Chthoniobacteraceae bacterium]